MCYVRFILFTGVDSAVRKFGKCLRLMRETPRMVIKNAIYLKASLSY